ncbi:hypothetical protein NDU88_000620 [Pleurodeles waltl]|uniref:Uncharacterized protein n=1 Tax=Pleurodeles waltl TaxID=8319 RepID=A0AAV7TFK6_PLEWA|nr:hypothetical protein NDU88_000620 [Pleurodeles waltl]
MDSSIKAFVWGGDKAVGQKDPTAYRTRWLLFPKKSTPFHIREGRYHFPFLYVSSIASCSRGGAQAFTRGRGRGG